MPALTGLLETSLYVEDLGRSVAFYRRLFEFEVIASNGRLCALSIEGKHVLLLFKKGASANLPSVPHDGSGQHHLAFAVTTDQLADWEQRLAQQNVAVEHKQHWDRGGDSLYFRDPDGHLLELGTPGIWSIY